MKLNEVLKFAVEIQTLAIPAGILVFALIRLVRRPFEVLGLKGIDKAIEAKSDDDDENGSGSLPIAA